MHHHPYLCLQPCQEIYKVMTCSPQCNMLLTRLWAGCHKVVDWLSQPSRLSTTLSQACYKLVTSLSFLYGNQPVVLCMCICILFVIYLSCHFNFRVSYSSSFISPLIYFHCSFFHILHFILSFVCPQNH